ncbi:MAG: hypothetical protein Q8J97_05020, partial [Flavobacteriaceae bacterium]|nr:hypothetical protein [Flavobacteriaceae bacterium]
MSETSLKEGTPLWFAGAVMLSVCENRASCKDAVLKVATHMESAGKITRELSILSKSVAVSDVTCC